MTRIAIRAITRLAHNVYQYDLDKPAGFTFTPGQATEVAIAKDGWEDERRPFTFTALPAADKLQFTIKSYPDHQGVTAKLPTLRPGDMLDIDEPWGTISYKGPGVFIAGGAGMTPFLAILRMLAADPDNADRNTLFFANKREADIFCRDELEAMDRLAVHHVLSEEERPGMLSGLIDRDFLKTHVGDFGQQFYVCGPDPMVKAIRDALKDLGADPTEITFEE